MEPVEFFDAPATDAKQSAAHSRASSGASTPIKLGIVQRTGTHLIFKR
jgi:hypothetical protein